MTLRAKTFLMITVPFLILLAVLYITSGHLIKKNIGEQENGFLINQMKTLDTALENDLAGLEMLAADWAGRDDVQEYMDTGHHLLVSKYMNETTFNSFQLDYILFLDESAKVRYGRGYNRTDYLYVNYPHEFVTKVSAESPLLPQEGEKSVTGLLQTNRGPVLFAAHTIYSADDAGKGTGTLIISRRLTLDALTNVKESMQLPLRYTESDEFTRPRESQSLELAGSSYDFYYQKNPSEITCYLVLTDVFGRPAGALTAILPRFSNQAGLHTYYSLAGIVTIAVLILCLLIYFILDKTLLTRVLRLVKTVQETLQEESQAGSDGKKDELSDFTGNVDSVISQLELSQRMVTVSRHMQDIVVHVDFKGNMLYASPSHKAVLGYSTEEVYRQEMYEHIHPDDIPLIHKANRELVGERKTQRLELRYRHANGHYIWMETLPTLICDEHDEPVSLLICSRDITARKKMEEQLRFYSLYDALTGLHNRNFFEQEMRRRHDSENNDVGMILCDVDGLKIINDGMGHDVGDLLLKSTAAILKDCFRRKDVVARIGGDEFAVLLPGSTAEQVEKACRRINEAVRKHNENTDSLFLSISVGYAVGDKTKDIHDIFKEADNHMYREKLHRSMSTRSSIVHLLMKALEARDYITEGHAERLMELVEGLAKAQDLAEHRLADLRLLAQFHDIGKVGIPDRILFKSTGLNEEERLQMQQHCEIGHRIALSAPDLVPIADWILKHHEWWNGRGYPFGLKEFEIPVECRILAIADAYDAMTNQRPYREAMSHEQAIAELRKYAGEQFDPHLTAVFIKMVNQMQLVPYQNDISK